MTKARKKSRAFFLVPKPRPIICRATCPPIVYSTVRVAEQPDLGWTRSLLRCANGGLQAAQRGLANSLPDTTSALKSLRAAEQDRAVTVLLRLSFLLLFRENRVPVILMSL